MPPPRMACPSCQGSGVNQGRDLNRWDENMDDYLCHQCEGRGNVPADLVPTPEFDELLTEVSALAAALQRVRLLAESHVVRHRDGAVLRQICVQPTEVLYALNRYDYNPPKEDQQ